VAGGVEEGQPQEAAILAAVTQGDEVVRAAGGVVWRTGEHGAVEVLLVHRPKYDDWTFPKGKLDAGEGEAEAALREVQEETGFRCVLGPELESSFYEDNRGRPKTVRYWAMSPLDGAFARPTRSTRRGGCRWNRRPQR
jgi:8-oxo-dGTP diphosphatase